MNLTRPLIAGCVIIYECDADLRTNIATYAADLDMLFIIDNSAQPNSDISQIVDSFPNIKYIFNGRNIGVAAALNLAIRHAKKRDAAFLLTMDQDSGFFQEPFCEYRDRVLEIPFINEIAVAAPTFIASESTKSGIMDSPTVITSGSILNLANQEHIGFFDERLFIDEVDHDYCLRATDLGFRVVTLTDYHLDHRLGQHSTVSIAGKVIRWNVHTPIRHYYMVRNGLYMLAKHHRQHPGYSARRFLRLSRTIAAALLMAPRRFERLRMISGGMHDFFVGRMGARGDAP